MMKLCINRLIPALRAAEPFALPAMNAGTMYLYKSLYKRLVSIGSVRLSELDFTAFEPEDVEALNNIYSDVFERNGYKANGVINILKAASPVCKTVGYV